MANFPLTTGQIAELIGGTVEGDPSVPVESIGPLATAQAGQVTFAANDKRAAQLAGCLAAAAIVAKTARVASAPMTLIRVDDVQIAVARLLGHLDRGEDLPPVGVAKTAVVSPEALLAEDVRVGPGCVVGPRAKVGRGSALAANVTIGSDVEVGRDVLLREGVVVGKACKIGDRVRIGPNSVIGYDGFGYYFANGKHHRISHIGNVVIEDDVEIGACSCVDRAKFGSTRIGAGTKIDNLVQVAHNVQVGCGCILVGQCGIAGSARLGDYVTLGGHAGVRDNIAVGGGATCAAYSAIMNDVPDGQTVYGIPAGPAGEKMRQTISVKRLPELIKRVGELEKKVRTLESPKDHQETRSRRGQGAV